MQSLPEVISDAKFILNFSLAQIGKAMFVCFLTVIFTTQFCEEIGVIYKVFNGFVKGLYGAA